jgi:DNA repair protein RadC
VFSPALEHNATAVIVAHNHPSGDPEPSAADRELTERLAEAGEILGIQLIKHFIVTKESHLAI